MYKVIVAFADLQDNKHYYQVGDVYPRKGYTPSPERVAELSGAKNKLKTPIIKEATKNAKRNLRKH